MECSDNIAVHLRMMHEIREAGPAQIYYLHESGLTRAI
jgi:hypothetical protein